MPIANDAPSSYGISIDAEGKWYYLGAEMFRKEIVQYFYQHLIRNQEGQYIIELENDRCLVEVEDCAFVVKAIYREQNDGKTMYYASLSDDSLELLDLSSLHFAQNNIPYCAVKKGAFPARLTRAAYYQLVETLELDKTVNRYFIAADVGRMYL
jgi:hypothetical protein